MRHPLWWLAPPPSPPLKRWDNKTVQPGCRPRENKPNSLRSLENRTTALRAREMHPFCLRHLPRRGRFALRSALGIISTTMHSTAKSSPSGEKVVPKVPKGVHFLRAIGAVVRFFLCYCPICKLSPPPSAKGDPGPAAAGSIYNFL